MGQLKTLPITRFRHIQNCSLVTTSFGGVSHHAGLISFMVVVIMIVTMLMMSGQEEEMRLQAGNTTGGLNLHVKVGGI